MSGARGTLSVVPGGLPDTEGTAASLTDFAAPAKPEGLAPAISDLWDEIVPALAGSKMISPMDFPTVVLALEHYDLARRAADDIRTNGLNVWDEKNARLARNPSVMIMNSATESFTKLSASLGLSFVSRARVNLAAQEKEQPNNPFA